MRRSYSPEICLRHVDGIVDLLDPEFQNACFRNRLIPMQGTKVRYYLARTSVLLGTYSILCWLSFLVAHSSQTSLLFFNHAVMVLLWLLFIPFSLFSLHLPFRSIYQLCKYKELPTTTHVALSLHGIRLISFFGRWQKEFFAWDDITSIRLRHANVLAPILRRQTSVVSFAGGLYCNAKVKREPCIEIRNRRNKVMRLRLSSIRSIEERRVLVDMIKKYARRAVEDDLSQITRVSNVQDLAFTQLWSNALNSAAPRRINCVLQNATLLQSGRYLILEQIGGGGQGAIYRAEMTDDAGQVHLVALKEYVLPDCEHVFDRKRAIEQFEREVQLLTRLHHPGIVNLIDGFVEDHRAYLVLELIKGETLKQLVTRTGPIPEQESIGIALKLCGILHYLHTSQPQVVHLDVTPENILISDGGRLKLIDFNTSSDGSGLRTKLIAGKQRYMSPEQFRNEVSPLCDIYALGCTLFFMFTGDEPEPLTSCDLAKSCPSAAAELTLLVARATELDGGRRIQAVQEMESRLALLLKEKQHE